MTDQRDTPDTRPSWVRKLHRFAGIASTAGAVLANEDTRTPSAEDCGHDWHHPWNGATHGHRPVGDEEWLCEPCVGFDGDVDSTEDGAIQKVVSGGRFGRRRQGSDAPSAPNRALTRCATCGDPIAYYGKARGWRHSYDSDSPLDHPAIPVSTTKVQDD